MNKSYRIRTNVGNNADKHIKLKLDQDISQFEILSLNLNQREFFPKFNCNHGVLVGRVNANNNVGIPNVKVSIFIPIDEEDMLSSKIFAIYPYSNPRDRNLDGKRYNLLPRVAMVRTDGSIRPQQPFGSFPTKPEIATNETFLEVYEKYYKYTTVTNESGDYMLFGVPVGTQTVHMSADITDIGRFSMKPSTMVTSLGYSENLFIDNTSKIKESSDLDDLPNIETQEISVDVIPFCGDDENYTIGITRRDFRIRAELVSTFIIFGSAFTDGEGEMWSNDFDGGSRKIRELYREKAGIYNIENKRIALIDEKIYTINNNISEDNVNDTKFTVDDITKLSSGQYSRFIREGDFAYIIPCNRKKIITNEFGLDVEVDSDFNGGAFTEFSGFMKIEIKDENADINFSKSLGTNITAKPFRFKFKIPQNAPNLGDSFFCSANDNDKDDKVSTSNKTQKWKRQSFTFKNNKIYSVARFHNLMFNNASDGANLYISNTGTFHIQDVLNFGAKDHNWNTGIIVTDDRVKDGNELHEFPSNIVDNNGHRKFGGNWLNFTLHLPVQGRATGSAVDNRFGNIKSSTNFTLRNKSNHFFGNNNDKLAVNDTNSKFMARSDLHYTDFIEVPISDLITINSHDSKGFTKSTLVGLTGDYRNGNSLVPVGGGRENSDPVNNPNDIDDEYYFYKGLGEADCIQHLFELGLV